MNKRPNKPADAIELAERLGARWSPNLDDYATGKTDQIVCVLCGPTCTCPPLGAR